MDRRFGWMKDEVPVVGQGTWNMGRDRRLEAEALTIGLGMGLGHIDTAELYDCEELVGAVIAEHLRDDVFLVSKVRPEKATRRGTIAACDASLRRLGIDYLDVYLLHWRDPAVPLAETMAALEELVGAGKIRALGVSNFDVADLQEAEKALTRERIACNQVYYSLDQRGIERRLLGFCQARDIAVVGYSPFGSGDFPAPDSKGGRVLAEVARRRRATVRQVALAFLVRLAGTFTIPKAARPEHVRENAGALDLTLTEEEVAALEQAFPLPPPGPLAMI